MALAVERMQIATEVRKAERRIRRRVRETPLERSAYLSQATGADVFLKLENQQLSGSFKLRGAMNKLLSLGDEARRAGIVTASSGNHAAACAEALHKLGGTGIIYLPETVSRAKVEALEPYGLELRYVGTDSVAGELEAKRVAERDGLVYVSPYSDPKIVGGQGTIAPELERQLESFDAVFVPVGGGGLVAGIAGYLKAVRPDVRVYGCQPELSRVMYESVRAGKILDLPSEPTLADGTAGGVDPDAITFSVCRRDVDAWVLLSEEEIGAAMRLAIEKHAMLIEGASALALAACLKQARELEGRRVVVIVTGKKVTLETLRRILGPS